MKCILFVILLNESQRLKREIRYLYTTLIQININGLIYVPVPTEDRVIHVPVNSENITVLTL